MCCDRASSRNALDSGESSYMEGRTTHRHNVPLKNAEFRPIGSVISTLPVSCQNTYDSNPVAFSNAHLPHFFLRCFPPARNTLPRTVNPLASIRSEFSTSESKLPSGNLRMLMVCVVALLLIEISVGCKGTSVKEDNPVFTSAPPR